MFKKNSLVSVAALAMLVGCGGGSGAFQKSGSPQAPSSPGATVAAVDADGAPAPAPPPAEPGSARSSDSAAEQAPAQRQGLATQWGETRNSRVHDVTFTREAGDPFAMATLHYNDRKGVNALAAVAERRGSRGFEVGGGAVSVSIRDSNGDPLEAVRAGGRTFVVGESGQRYSIVLQNHTSHRFEAVATVDGLDVINGRQGSFSNRGYVLMPFATLEIDGFRQSTATVAAFRFGAVGDSYAAQTGSARNVGVIGVAFFSERGDSFVDGREIRTRDTASPFPADPRFAPPPPR
ncbi:MAG: hypothetical protein KC657_23335 [Myxococcales bacterium]|nr:hypothetical protein [Myxococcales bacterium]